MKKKTSLLVLLASIGMVGSITPVFTGLFKDEGTAFDVPSNMLYAAPASVNSPHTYLQSPTNEPWYKDSHSFKNTSTLSDGVYYQRNQATTMYERMNVTGTWNSYRGENVKVAVIDTGCYTSHEDFNGTNIKTISKNMVSSTTGLTAVNDTNGHGTTSAATIAAAVNSVGGTGIAPNVELIILKCVNSSNAFDSNAIKNALQYCIDNDVDIINMSIQGYNVSSNFSASWLEDFGNYTVTTTSQGIMTPTMFSSKINDCYNAGITIVAAAGNYNTNRESYPAANDHVIAVASTGLTEENKLKKAGYSNYGSWIDICAPGYVTTPTLTSSSTYSVTNGTSFSAPLVTGAIALYKSKYPNATPDQIEKALKATATKVDWEGGAGAINVGAFLDHAPDVLVESITLDEQYKTIKVGETYQISPTVLPADANDSILYESSDPDICSVSSTGLVKALKTGSSIIECSSSENSDISDMVEVTVEAASSSATNITYWADWISKNQSSINTGGTTLLSALRTRISNVAPGSTNTLSYDDLWDAYATTDGIPGSNGTKIYDMYGGFEFTKGTDQAGTYHKEGDVYNREHSVPKSWFGEAKPAYSDIVHLVPTDGYVNGRRSNYTFGEVSSATYSYSFPARSYNGVQYQLAGVSKLGSPKTINGVSCPSSPVFEPDDQYKGDFARIYMYFATRYGGTSCSATSGDGASMFSSNCTEANPYMTNYGLALIRKWHEQDPVSEKEKLRNDGIEQTQGNRNPFVDYPEWADKIFGTHTGPAEPTVTISQTTAFIPSNGSIQLTATASDGSSITWSSSNKNAATVSSSGFVSGVAAGSTTITASATIEGKTYSATCNVTVTAAESPIVSISISGDFTKKNYNVGDSWSNVGLVVTATRENGQNETVANSDVSWSYSPEKPALSTNSVTVTATYRSKSNSKTVTGITVAEQTITSETITRSSCSGTGGYAWYDWSQGSISGQLYYYATEKSKIQMNSNKTGKALFSTTTNEKHIDSIQIKSFENSTPTITVYGSNTKYTTETTTSGSKIGEKQISNSGSNFEFESDYKYFSIVVPSGGAAYLSEITVNFRNAIAPKVNSIILDKNSVSLDLNGVNSALLNPTVNAEQGAVTTISWESSNVDVATVSKNSGSADEGITVTGHSKGFATITATCGDKTATCDITVTDSLIVIAYELVPNNETIPFMHGKGISQISATLYDVYNDSSKKEVQSVEIDVDTKSIGVKQLSKSFGGHDYTGSIKVTNDGTSGTIGEGTSEAVSETITASLLTASTTSYTEFSGLSIDKGTGAVYAGMTAKDNSGNIQIKSKNSNSGIVQTKSGGKVSSIKISIGSGTNTINIYGKNSSYSSAADLYDESKQGTLLGSTSTTATISFTADKQYDYIGIKSSNGACYISSIEVTCGTTSSFNATFEQQALAWANFFIEQTRTTETCLAEEDSKKLSGLQKVWANLAFEYNHMVSGSKDAFCSKEADSRIIEALGHYQFIISKFGKDSQISDFIKDGSNNYPRIINSDLNLFDSTSGSTILIASVFVLGSATITGFYFYRKRKEN